jgi:hypothetical protein
MLVKQYRRIGSVSDLVTVFSCNRQMSAVGQNTLRFKVLTAASMKFRIVFWDVLLCKIIVDRRFRGTYCLHHQGWNVVRQLFYTAVHPRRQFWAKYVELILAPRTDNETVKHKLTKGTVTETENKDSKIQINFAGTTRKLLQIFGIVSKVFDKSMRNCTFN